MAGDNVDVALEELEYAIVIIYIGGIPLSNLGLRGLLYMYFFKSFLVQMRFWEFDQCVIQ